MDVTYLSQKRRKRVKLIFNPMSGSAKASPDQLMRILAQMQAWKLLPEVFLLEPDADVPKMVAEAMTHGITLFAACGGDGTVSTVARALAGLPATLGILPTGTQNNIARSLGIPADIDASIAVLRTGRRVRIDLGILSCEGKETPFLEVCSIGLTSSIFESADEIQHGHLDRIGDFITTLFASAPSEIKMTIDGTHRISAPGHVVAVANMPFTGRHFQVGGLTAYRDGLLDVLFLGDISKLTMLGYALNKRGAYELDDPRVRQFSARSIEIQTDPPMQVMADGQMLGVCPAQIEIRRHALGVMTSGPVRNEEKDHHAFAAVQ